MAPIHSAVVADVASATSSSPSQLDLPQTLRATKALVRKIHADDAANSSSTPKASLLADADTDDTADAVPIWLVLTTKKHITDKKRLKPGKIVLPNPYLSADSPALRICLITADPQRKYKDLIASPAFPADLAARIPRVLGLEKLKAKYSSFESKRQLLSEYDLFLADDRVVTYLPGLLGKTFYKSTAKRPIPVSLEGKRQSIDPETSTKRLKLSEGGSKVPKAPLLPADLAAEIRKALSSTLVHLAPSTTTSVKIGTAEQSPADLQANVSAAVAALVEKYVPQKWRNVRSIHLKGPNTAALPIWMTAELWADESQVLDAPLKKRKREALTAGNGAAAEGSADVLEVPGPDGKMRRLEKPVAPKRKSGDAAEPVPEEGRKKKRKSGDVEADKLAEREKLALEVQAADKAEKLARKEALKAQKLAARADAGAEEKAAVETKAVASSGADDKVKGKGKGKKQRMKAADLM